jgi:putative membrane protein
MKSLIHFYYTLVLGIFLFSCNNQPVDPIKSANKENRDKIDSQLTTQEHVDSVAGLPSKADASFMVNAASGAMLEVQLGQLAQTQSRNERVKQFGTMMIKDHKEGGEKLKAMASSQKITLPDSVSNRQQKEIERLQKMKGVAFDEAYINRMVDDHKKDIREFEEQAKNGTNEAVKAFARGQLLMLYKHLDSAVSIQKVVPKTKSPTPDLPVGY